MIACPGLEAFGLDISQYALMHCEPEAIGRLHLGNALELPFPDNSFKAAISLNTIHNLDRAGCISGAEGNPARVGRPRLRAGRLLSHAGAEGDFRGLGADRPLPRLSATAGSRCFDEAGYTGDYYWTIIEYGRPQDAFMTDRAKLRRQGGARARCQRYRRRILDMSQTRLGAAHRRRLLLHRDRRLHLQRADAPSATACPIARHLPDVEGARLHDPVLSCSRSSACSSAGRSRRLLHAGRPPRRASGLRQSRHRGLDRLARPRPVDGGGHGARRTRPATATA